MLEDQPCESQFQLPYYLNKRYEENILPFLYEIQSQVENRKLMGSSQTAKGVMNESKRIVAIKVNAWKNCAAEYAYARAKNRFMKLYMSKQDLIIRLGVESYENLNVTLRKIDVDGYSDLKDLVDSVSMIDTTNKKAIIGFKDSDNFIKSQKRLFEAEVAEYFNFSGLGELSSVEKYFNKVKNLNDASKTFEDLAIVVNEYLLTLEVYNYFTKQTSIFKN